MQKSTIENCSNEFNIPLGEHKKFKNSINTHFSSSIKNKNYEKNFDQETREKCRNKIVKSLVKNIPYCDNEYLKNYGTELESCIYFNFSCFVGHHYRNEILRFCNAFNNCAYYLISKFSPKDLSIIPNDILIRGSRIHLASIKKNIDYVKFGNRNTKFIESIRREINFYAEAAEVERDLEKNKFLEENYEMLNSSLENSLSNVDVEIDGIEKCLSCGSHKTTHYQIQTRSADEGMTVYFTCLNCWKKWKK